jgi:hypothetical protein
VNYILPNGILSAFIGYVPPDILLSTIQYTLRQEANRKENISPQSGALRKLFEEVRDHIYEHIMRNPHIKDRELLEELEFQVRRTSFWHLTQ